MPLIHKIQPGESLHSIAGYYGFGIADSIADHPDNTALLAERAETGLQPGDQLTIPDGKHGESSHGTGRGHVIAVQVPPKTFLLRLYAGFYKENPKAPGDLLRRAPGYFYGFDRPIWQIQASVQIILLEGQSADPKPQSGTTSGRTGCYSTAALWDGVWKLEITPTDAELSSGPAAADPSGDHGLGYYTDKSGARSGKPKKPLPSNRVYELEFRPLVLIVTVLNAKIVEAYVSTPRAPGRPHHAVPFWKNCHTLETSTSVTITDKTQVLDVDWKPDFLRRVQEELRPAQKKRAGAGTIDIIQLHQTSGHNIAGALSTFLGPKEDSGAHFVVDRDGHVVRLADDRYYTKHGGGRSDVRKPIWANRTSPSINDRAIGIEHAVSELAFEGDALSDPDDIEHEFLYTDAQYEATISLVNSLIAAYGVPRRNVIGHQDVAVKALCPGWVLDWPRLERANVAMGPSALSPAESAAMFGGFFGGPEGQTRTLPIGAREKLVSNQGVTTTTVLDSAGNELASALPGHPIRELRQALLNIGYSPDQSLSDLDNSKARINKASDGVFGRTMGFALSQMIRHYCTGARRRADLWRAYRDSPMIWHKLFVDYELAKLLKELEKTALNLP